MRAASMGLALLPLLAGQIALAQTPQPKDAAAPAASVVEDFKPASSNQGGKEYPQVNSERRARFRIVAPQAQSVKVPEWVGGGPRRGAPPVPGGAGGAPRPRFDVSGFAKIMTEELIPFIDANDRTIADQPQRGMAELSMGGGQTRRITLANLDKFSHIGLFSGGSIAANDPALADPSTFKQKVKVLFVSYGSKENTTASKANHEALEKLGIKNTYYESPNTAHEWQTWRRSLYRFAPLLFRD